LGSDIVEEQGSCPGTLNLEYRLAWPIADHFSSQSVKYPDEAHLAKYEKQATGIPFWCSLAFFHRVLNKVKALPPLVTPSEVRLAHHCGEVAANLFCLD
jgi:hypothetical protein